MLDKVFLNGKANIFYSCDNIPVPVGRVYIGDWQSEGNLFIVNDEFVVLEWVPGGAIAWKITQAMPLRSASK